MTLISLRVHSHRKTAKPADEEAIASVGWLRIPAQRPARETFQAELAMAHEGGIILPKDEVDQVGPNYPRIDTKGDACGIRWKIEQFHRETKQLTGLEGCQCRKARIVRNRIGCAILVWVRLIWVAHETERTVYQVKHSLLSDYMRQQLKSPAIGMVLA